MTEPNDPSIPDDAIDLGALPPKDPNATPSMSDLRVPSDQLMQLMQIDSQIKEIKENKIIKTKVTGTEGEKTVVEIIGKDGKHKVFL